MSQENEARAARANPADWDEEEEWDVGKPIRNGGARRGALADEGDGLRRPKKARKTREPRNE